MAYQSKLFSGGKYTITPTVSLSDKEKKTSAGSQSRLFRSGKYTIQERVEVETPKAETVTPASLLKNAGVSVALGARPSYGTTQPLTTVSPTMANAQRAAAVRENLSNLRSVPWQSAAKSTGSLLSSKPDLAGTEAQRFDAVVQGASDKRLEELAKGLRTQVLVRDEDHTSPRLDKVRAIDSELTARKNERFYTELAARQGALEQVGGNADFRSVVEEAKNGLVKPGNLLTGNADARNIVRDIQLLLRQEKGENVVDEIGEDAKHLTDTQRDTLLYYAGTGQWDRASEYLDSIQRELNAAKAQAQMERVSAFSQEHPVMGAVGNVAASFATPAAWLGNLVQTAKNAVTGTYEPTDTNSNWFEGTHLSQATREGVSKAAELGVDIAGKDIGSFLAETGLSIGQFLSKVPLGPAALGYMGAGAAGETTYGALEGGATPGQALALGTASGLIEAATEKLGLDNLLDLATNGSKSALVGVLKQMGAEAGEEAISEVANTLTELAVLGENSDFRQYVNSLVQSGMSREEAEAQALKQFFLVNTAWAAAGGALSGGLTGTGATLISGPSGTETAQPVWQNKTASVSTGAGIYTTEEAEAIRHEGRTFRNLVAGFDSTVSEFFSKWASGRKSHQGEKLEKLYLGKMSEEVKQEVSNILGYEVMERDFIVTNDDVKHIMDEHGNPAAEIRKGNLPLEQWVFDALPSVLANPDTITAGHEGTGKNIGKTGVVFTKTMPDGRIVSVQYDNKGRGTMEIATVYAKESTPSVVNTSDEINTFTPKTTEPVLSSGNTVPQPADGVKPRTAEEVRQAAIQATVAEGQRRQREARQAERAGNAADLETSGAGRVNAQRAKTPAQNASGRRMGRASQNPGLTRDVHFRQANLSSRTARTLDAVARAAGVEVRFAPRVTEKGAAANAKYQDGVITIALDAQDPVRTAFTHELIHRIREASPEAYDALETFVRDHMRQGSLEALGELYGETYETEDANVYTEELVADAFGVLLGDSGAMEEFVREDRSAAQKVLDAIRDFIAAIKRALKGQNVKLTQEDRSLFAELESDLAGMEQALAEALRTVEESGAAATEDSGARYSSPQLSRVISPERRAAARRMEDLNRQYGTIKPGENPARQVQVPRRTADDKKVSQTVRTVMEAQATPEEALPVIETMVAEGDFSYEVYGDEEAIRDAEEYITNRGWGDAQREWFKAMEKGEVSNAGFVPVVATKNLTATAIESLLDKEDMWFSRPHYAAALASYCKANGITAAQIKNGQGMDWARAYAMKEAQKATYRDVNALSTAISGWGRYEGKNPVAKGISTVMEGILPFRKTPANILARGLEYSPAGLLKSISYDIYKVKKGDMTATEMIDDLSAGLTGTALMVLGFLLAGQGLIRGRGAGDEEEREFDELQGHQSYSLEAGDISVTLDWLAPECLPFFVGVNLWEATAGGAEEVTMAEMLTAIGNVTEPMMEMSCLQSLNDIFDAVGYAQSDGLSGLPSALITGATSYLTSGVPTLLGQIERSGQSRRMTTYTEKNDFLTGDAQYTLGSLSGKVPGWDYGQIVWVDAWGRTEDTGTTGERIFNNALDPAYTSTIETSPMEKELERLYDATEDASVFPSRAAKYFNVDGKRLDLSASQYVMYAKAKGQRSYEMLTELTESAAYKAMDDAEKAEAVGLVYDYANALAKASVSKYQPEGWIAEAQAAAKSTGISETQYVTLYLAQRGVSSLKDKDGETISNSKGLQIMELIYNAEGLNAKQRQQLFKDFGVGQSVIGYSEAEVKKELERMRKMAG